MTGYLDEALHHGLEPVASSLSAYASPELAGDVPRVIGPIERAYQFYVDRLGLEPRVAVLVLGPDDWGERSQHPLYGMPNYRDGNLILAGQPNPFWSGMVELAASEVADALPRLAQTYGGRTDAIDLTPFFDLLGVHELAHIFIEADGRVPSRFWVLEVACNILLHAYVATEEPDLLPSLETFPSVFGAIAPSRFTHRSLEDFEHSYAHGMDGANYGWFQAQFHITAKDIYNSVGPSVINGVWQLLAAEPSGDVERLLAEHFGAPGLHLLRQLEGPSA